MVLPIETLVDVFGFLDYKTSARLLIVSRRCNAILTPQMILQAEKLLLVHKNLMTLLDELKKKCEVNRSERVLLQQEISNRDESIFLCAVILVQISVDDPRRPTIINMQHRFKQLKKRLKQFDCFYKSRQTTLSQQLDNLVNKLRNIEQTIPNKLKSLIE